jgi:hypothetical protein
MFSGRNVFTRERPLVASNGVLVAWNGSKIAQLKPEDLVDVSILQRLEQGEIVR